MFLLNKLEFDFINKKRNDHVQNDQNMFYYNNITIKIG